MVRRSGTVLYKSLNTSWMRSEFYFTWACYWFHKIVLQDTDQSYHLMNLKWMSDWELDPTKTFSKMLFRCLFQLDHHNPLPPETISSSIQLCSRNWPIQIATHAWLWTTLAFILWNVENYVFQMIFFASHMSVFSLFSEVGLREQQRIRWNFAYDYSSLDSLQSFKWPILFLFCRF